MSVAKVAISFAILVTLAGHTNSLDLEGIDCKALGRLLNLKNINDAYFPHESDCDVFYHCGLSGATLKPCGSGTIFSLRNKDCRRPEETKCKLLDKFLEKKQIQLEQFYNEDY